MLIKELAQQLDDFFQIKELNKDLPFSFVLPEIFNKLNYDWRKYFSDDFLKSYHGLMLNNGVNVQKIIGTVFLDRGVLEKLFQRDEKNVLIFTHHPLEDQTAGAGFIALPEKYLQELKKRNISVYSIHTPLDIHAKVSTVLDFAKGSGIHVSGQFIKDQTGWVGTTGHVHKHDEFDEYISFLQTTTGGNRVNFIKRTNQVGKVAVIPGGGTDPSLILEAIYLECDTYLTGEYYNKLHISHGEQERTLFERKIENTNINLIEVSHYWSERFVFQDSLKQLITRQLQLKYEFVEQENAWY